MPDGRLLATAEFIYKSGKIPQKKGLEKGNQKTNLGSNWMNLPV